MSATEVPSLVRSTPHPVTGDERAEYLDFAIELAEAAGQVILPHFRRGIAVDNKAGEGDYDPVTQADREAERAMCQRIERRYPDHGILGEEFGYRPGRNAPTWVLDPIDGTRGFVMGLLHWGTLVALFDGVKPVVGVIRQPFLDETFVGNCMSAECHRAGERIDLRTRQCGALADAFAGTTTPDLFKTEAERAGFQRIATKVRGMRYGTDCYLYAMIALGMADLAIETDLKPYDVQALMPVVEGAGGCITDWQGGNPSMGGRVLATGDPRLHEAALEALAGI